MIETALILAELGRAVFQEEGRLYMLTVEADEKAVPCRRGDLTLLLDSGVEVVELAGDRLSLASLRNDLHALHSRYRALSFALSGMDPDFSVETRSLCIDAAEELMQDDETRGFVRGRLLARQLPVSGEADIATALREARMLEARHLTAVYEDVERLQPAIRDLLSAWAMASSKFFDGNEQAAAEAERVLIDLGVFASLTVALGSGKEGDLNSAVVLFSLDRDLGRRIPRCSLLLNSVRTELKSIAELAPVSGSNHAQDPVETDHTIEASGETDPIRQLILGNAAGTRPVQKKKISALEAKQKVDRQIAELNKALQAGNWSRFEDYLEDLVAFQIARSEPKHLGMTLCSLAISARDTGRLDLATRLVSYAHALHVEDAVIWNTRAEVLRAGGSLHEALTAYEETAQLFPDNVVMRNGQAEVLKAMGRLDEALIAYEETVRLFPSDVFARTGRAEVLKTMGRLDEALAAYEETSQLFPSDVFARNGRAEVLKAMGRLDEALAGYEETAQLFPSDVVTRNGRAAVLKAMGRLDEALAAYEETSQLFPSDVVTRNGQAEVFKAMGRLDEALAAYEETSHLFPSDVVARNGQAEVLKEMERLDEALAAYEETSHLFPSDVVTRNGRATVLVLLDRITEARMLVDNSEPVSEQDWIGYHIVAMSYLRMKDYTEAVERLSLGADRVPWPYLRRYFETALAVALIRKRVFDRAAKILEQEARIGEAARRQLCLVLLAHSQAELGQRAAAVDSLAGISGPAKRAIKELKSALFSYYELAKPVPSSTTRSAVLLREIEQREFRLALAA